MKIYGVLDLLRGQVVHGIAGQRAAYRPIVSRIATSADPGEVARAFAVHAGLSDAYIADLDAIAGAEPNWTALQAVADEGLEILVDAGCGDVQRAGHLASHRFARTRRGISMLSGIVVGLESLTEPQQLPALLEAIGVDRAVFSLDLRGGVPMVGAVELADWSACECAEMAWRAGFRRLIVLDVAAVGVAGGPTTLELCRTLRAAHAWPELISGGGVRDERDIQALANAGCDGVLVASALHQGRCARK